MPEGITALASGATERDAQLAEARALRSRVASRFSLPDVDLSNMRPPAVGAIIETLEQIVRSTNHNTAGFPFAEVRSDSPGAVWLKQPGQLMKLLAEWAEQQLERATHHLETLSPIDADEVDERTLLLLARYARMADFEKAVSLVAGFEVPATTPVPKRVAA